MKNFTTTTLFICGLVVICLVGCQNKKPKPNPELASIELLRGDIALCGNPEFGEVRV